MQDIARDCKSKMGSIIILIVTGFVVGALGTMVGSGGGFILVPLLIITHPEMPSATTTAISIAVVGLNAISGSIAYARSKRIDFKSGLLFGAFTIPGSILGVVLIIYIPKQLFNIIFGFILIAIASYLFLNNSKVAKVTPIQSIRSNTVREITDRDSKVFKYSFNKAYGITISILVGFLSPLLGIGGGIIHVPAMVQWLQFPVYIATATSHFILAFMSVVSVIMHCLQGSYKDPQVQRLLLYLCIGVVPGAQLGAFLSHRKNSDIVIKILAICIMLAGVRILF